ncbi:hypothetical protein BRADI_2g46204v3 [Brachypodium distachyon]|uniref:Uncharacterized protein n=1 Tax=Brachypodium distachyon TaxID=15368 RepID=A0A2K2DE86_BRADI|nr:hypothetical protein BRADI_2g46204v3 [Brachypodium distachyon]
MSCGKIRYPRFPPDLSHSLTPTPSRAAAAPHISPASADLASARPCLPIALPPASPSRLPAPPPPAPHPHRAPCSPPSWIPSPSRRQSHRPSPPPPPPLFSSALAPPPASLDPPPTTPASSDPPRAAASKIGEAGSAAPKPARRWISRRRPPL